MTLNCTLRSYETLNLTLLVFSWLYCKDSWDSSTILIAPALAKCLTLRCKSCCCQSRIIIQILLPWDVTTPQCSKWHSVSVPTSLWSGGVSDASPHLFFSVILSKERGIEWIWVQINKYFSIIGPRGAQGSVLLSDRTAKIAMKKNFDYLIFYFT